MGSGVLSFHAFMCSHVVTEHLFTARLWTPRDSVVSRKHVSLPLPCLCCWPAFLSPGLQSHTASPAEAEQTLEPDHLGSALRSDTSFLGDFGQEIFLFHVLSREMRMRIVPIFGICCET